jgi:hypothetical protein
MNVRRVQFLQHVFNVVGGNDVLRQFAIQIVIGQKLFVATQLKQPIHHVVSIFFFNSHGFVSCCLTKFLVSPSQRQAAVAPELVSGFAMRQEVAALF